MPVYEYECDVCHERFERLQRLSDPLIKKCPHCGGPVQKLFSVPALQFKGSGFYVTDYAHRSGGSPTSAHSEQKSSETKHGGSKSV